jgi:hypothetical protein
LIEVRPITVSLILFGVMVMLFAAALPPDVNDGDRVLHEQLWLGLRAGGRCLA